MISLISMQKMDAKELLEKYKLGICTDAEKDIVETWYQTSGIGEPNKLTDQAIDESLDRVWNKLSTGKDWKTNVVRLWPRIAAVAAVVACVVYGVYFFNSPAKDSVSGPYYASDVAPGKVGATLTLASGKKIRLADADNGELAKEAGISVTKIADGQLVYEVNGAVTKGGQLSNTLSTAKGETYQIKLPDGSTVMLNALSSLTYPANFTSLKNRTVGLQGEAYFQIAKDKLHPFVVKNGAQDVEVLGTHFNVSTYAGEPTITTLEEGLVKVITSAGSTMIRPGQKVINNGNSLKVEEADLEEALAWKNGNFIFSGEGIQDIMRQLERWYDIEVVFDGNVTKEGFYANISRYKNISQVLKMLEKTKAVHFSIEGRRVTVRN